VIIAVDPGPEESALVILDRSLICEGYQQPNDFILERIHGLRHELPNAVLVIEKVVSFGMPVGAEVFETVFWSGRFAEAFGIHRVHRVTRPDVKMHLCHSMRAKDGNIRQALIDRFGPVGTKKQPGVLYGISKHLWSALAVAVTHYDQSHIGTAPAGVIRKNRTTEAPGGEASA
jgi:hypothetical protein